ncbi:MAG: hypothetical protein QOH12_7 [Solirubrobacteraceae bacterium]|jgi:hypothetical protein|nr:hypothetical protein [Solirubrobacteraceae bacterium]
MTLIMASIGQIAVIAGACIVGIIGVVLRIISSRRM